MEVFLEDVKSNEDIFLKKFQFQSGVKGLSGVMAISFLELMKFFRRVFEDYDGVDGHDFFVAEIFLSYTADTLVLPEKKIGRVAGASRSGEFIADFLDFQIDDRTVC